MNHIYLIRLVVLKRPGFQSQKYGMPSVTGQFRNYPISWYLHHHLIVLLHIVFPIVQCSVHRLRKKNVSVWKTVYSEISLWEKLNPVIVYLIRSAHNLELKPTRWLNFGSWTSHT